MRQWLIAGTAWICGAMTACMASCTPARDTERAGAEEIMLLHDGLERRCRVFVPTACQAGEPARPCPVLLAFHWAGGTGEGMSHVTGFDALARREGFIAAYPDGVALNWNDGRPEVNPTVDDVGFVSLLLDELVARYDVDEARVYATGLSNGGQMCYRLAMEMSERIAAIAPVAALLSEALSSSAAPARPTPVMIIHGTEDPITPFAGGVVGGIFDRGRALSASATLSFWVHVNNAEEAAGIEALPDGDPDDGTLSRREVHQARAGGGTAEVILVTVEGGGHAWPGGERYLPPVLVGRTSHDFSASEEIWRFFSGHSTP